MLTFLEAPVFGLATGCDQQVAEVAHVPEPPEVPVAITVPITGAFPVASQ